MLMLEVLVRGGKGVGGICKEGVGWFEFLSVVWEGGGGIAGGIGGGVRVRHVFLSVFWEGEAGGAEGSGWGVNGGRGGAEGIGLGVGGRYSLLSLL